MNTNNFTKKLIDQWPAKLICLVLAIGLYILHQTSLLEKKTYIVPLKIVENGNVSVIGHVPSSVSIIIRASKDDIAKISNDDISVDIDLSNLTENGEYTLPLNLVFSEEILASDSLEVKVKPESITVNVEKKVLKYVPVIPSTVGDVAEGYKIDNIEVNPPYVPIVGPESLVNATESIFTTRVNVSNATTNFAAEAEGYPINKLIQLQDKGPYKVTITLGQADMVKDYNEIVVVLYNMPENLKIAGNTPLVNVTLSGKAPFLDKYVISRNFVTADFSEITEPGVYEVPLTYISNPNFEIVKKSAETITVTIVEKNAESEEEVPPIEEKLESAEQIL